MGGSSNARMDSGTDPTNPGAPVGEKTLPSGEQGKSLIERKERTSR